MSVSIRQILIPWDEKALATMISREGFLSSGCLSDLALVVVVGFGELLNLVVRIHRNRDVVELRQPIDERLLRQIVRHGA